MIQHCPKCGAPLTILNSIGVKQCIDHELHTFDNKLKPHQQPLVKATR